MMLESIPRIFRGLVASSIKKQIPTAEYERSAAVFRDEAIWKQRLAAIDDRRAYVVLIDDKTHICWMNSGPFHDSALRQLREAASRIRRPPI